MKAIYIIPFLIGLFACAAKKTEAEKKETKVVQRETVIPKFQTILDTADVEGAILIYDLEEDRYYSNDFDWTRKGNLPASTFKITNSIIGLETGVVESDSTLFPWNGEKRRLKLWEQDLIFRDAFHFSCVPCYREIARKIGESKMNEFLEKLEYGDMKVDSSNVDLFWLVGASKISQYQQIDFLQRFYQSKLPISERTEQIMKLMMVIEDSEDYKLSGKTGWSITDDKNNAWFVGYVETQSKAYFFATNVEPKEQFNMDRFPMVRKEVTLKALEAMEIIG